MLQTVKVSSDNNLDLMERGRTVEHRDGEEKEDKITTLAKDKIHKKEESEDAESAGVNAPEEAAASSCLGAIFCGPGALLGFQIFDGIAVAAGVAMVVFAGIMISSGQVNEQTIGLLGTGIVLIIVGVQALIITNCYSSLLGLNEAVKKLEEENEEYSEENDEHRALNAAQGEQILALTAQVTRQEELNREQGTQIGTLRDQVARHQELNVEQKQQIESLRSEIARQIEAHNGQIEILREQIVKQEGIQQTQLQQIELLKAEGVKYQTLNRDQAEQLVQLTAQNASQKEYIARFNQTLTAFQREGEKFTATGKGLAEAKQGLDQTKQGFDSVLRELDTGVKQGVRTLNENLSRDLGVFRRLHEKLELLERRFKLLETNYKEVYDAILQAIPTPVPLERGSAAIDAAPKEDK